jgi:hypothetical protein
MALGEPIRVARLVADQLERQNISYAVVGSLASSAYGIPRSTQDVDIVAAVNHGDVDVFVSGLERDFYVSRPMIEEAIENRSSFNVIHLDTMLKVDVFVVPESGLAGNELERAETYVFESVDNTELEVASAEDVLVRKLEWYRSGGEVSDQQWNDILGIIEVEGDRLDWDYMEGLAAKIGVEDLLNKARAEAEI